MRRCAREVASLAKKLHQRIRFERGASARGQFVVLENHIAIKPCNQIAVHRKMLQRDIEEPLLLPQYVTAGKLNEDFGILGAQLEASGRRHLDRDQRNLQTFPEVSIVVAAAPIPRRIEIRGDPPEHCDGASERLLRSFNSSSPIMA